MYLVFYIYICKYILYFLYRFKKSGLPDHVAMHATSFHVNFGCKLHFSNHNIIFYYYFHFIFQFIFLFFTSPLPTRSFSISLIHPRTSLILSLSFSLPFLSPSLVNSLPTILQIPSTTVSPHFDKPTSTQNYKQSTPFQLVRAIFLGQGSHLLFPSMFG